MQYLCNNKEEALDKLKYSCNNMEDVKLCQGQIQGIEWFLELETEFDRYRLVTEAEQQRLKAINERQENIYQAVVEGKTRF